jgi:tetraacyldisaccharide 4'-kinase
VNVLSAIFGRVVDARNAMYDRGLLRAERLRGPVVSVGNISAGGSGKTPFVIMLGEMLKQRDVAFDVLSRGYRRASSQVALVDPDGSRNEFGDEPLLIAQRLGVPVIVGRDRFQAGTFAEERFGPEMHLLDDGFQHRRLMRDFDIVLLTPEDETDTLLPVGRLREPHTSLARADAVVLMRGARQEAFPLVNHRVWRAHRGVQCGQLPTRPLVFCGIAKPEVFFEQVRACGVTPGAQVTFRDHHAYRDEDVRKLLDIARQRATNGFVTTEKDRLNLGPLAQRLQPLHLVRATVELEGADAFMDHLLSTITARPPRRS